MSACGPTQTPSLAQISSAMWGQAVVTWSRKDRQLLTLSRPYLEVLDRAPRPAPASTKALSSRDPLVYLLVNFRPVFISSRLASSRFFVCATRNSLDTFFWRDEGKPDRRVNPVWGASPLLTNIFAGVPQGRAHKTFILTVRCESRELHVSCRAHPFQCKPS